MVATKTVRLGSRGELVPSTLLGKCARISLNFLRKRSISTEGSLSLSEKKVAIVSTEELHFYGTNTFLLEGSRDCFYRRSTRQSRERSQLFKEQSFISVQNNYIYTEYHDIFQRRMAQF